MTLLDTHAPKYTAARQRAHARRHLLTDLGIGHRDRGGASPPALHGRALATLRRATLDRCLADGDVTADSPELAARAWQITRTAERERLAAALDHVLIRAQRPWSRGAAVPVSREQVEVARHEILYIAGRLRDERRVRPRGVALLRRLLSDGGGPLYVPSVNDELYRRLREVTNALE
jgi:hypothetical protein